MGGDRGCFGEKSNHLNLNLDTNSSRHLHNITIAVWRHAVFFMFELWLVLCCLQLYYTIVLALDEILFLFFSLYVKWLFRLYRFKNATKASIGAPVRRKWVSNQ